MAAPAYIIGIDLGTTNCAVAFAHPGQGADAPASDFPVAQLLRPGEVAALPLLPSCLYAAGEHELPAGSTQLPWGESPRLLAGAFARWQGARVPGRLVASAKSWLCHSGVDRSAPILPWGAPAGVSKISPVEASARLLAHLGAAWNHAHPDAPIAQQEVVITVPASFDEVARALTVTAVRQAGWEKFSLVEEPQAAFYDFTSRHRYDLAAALDGVRLVLVVDVGGGTTDFTLIQAGATPEGPALRRLAVGEHLMLGGDNMDAALARLAEERLLAGGRKFSAAQWTQLLQATREAKESLLGDQPPERHHVAVAAEGSRLLGGTMAAELQRDEVARAILDGFFPACAAGETPRRAARTALQELGLPYAQDAAITRHLAAFLRQHSAAAFAALEGTPAGESSAGLPRPDAILLNGGVFNSPAISDRLLSVLSAWWPESPRVRMLPHSSLELAVARGAVGHGLARRGLGRRIGGGAAHALYVGLAGEKGVATARAICLIPRGHETGQPVELTGQPFELTLGRPVQFPLFSTTSDRIDRPGEVVEISEDFRALPPIHTLLQSAAAKPAARPVHLRAVHTELGTLELWCVSSAGDERWRLEFELRGVAAGPAMIVTEAMPARFADARAAVERVFGHKPLAVGLKEVKQLRRALEQIIGAREDWRLPLLRELWSGLQAGARNRRRSADHERVFFQLAGFCLRPGFGYPLDEWRCEQLFGLFADGVMFHTEPQVWSEFWILWRRIAGGLSEARQQELWSYLKPHLARRIPPAAAKKSGATVSDPAGLHTPAPQPGSESNAHLPKLKGVRLEGLDEMVRVAASLEHLEAAEKIELGNWISARLQNPATAAGPWTWALGRLGARVPAYGSGHKTVPPDQAAAWLAALLAAGLHGVDGSAFAAVQLCRLTGDRTRDLDAEIRARTLAALQAAAAPADWLRPVAEVVQLAAADEARVLGDTLPLGLRLR